MKANDAASFRTHDTHPTDVALGPRHQRPCSDDVVLTVDAKSWTPRSAVLSRAQMAELHEWIGKWLADGWDGVPFVEGPTTTDVIRHFQDVALTARVALDHARSDHHREVEALAGLLPPERRPVDLAKFAAWQSEQWARIEATSSALETFRLAFVGLVYDMKEVGAEKIDPAKLLAVLEKMLKKYNHPHPKLPDPVPDAPIYNPGDEQLALFGATPA